MSRGPGDPIAPRVHQEAASLMVEMSFRGTEPGRAGRVSATWAVALECSFLFSPGPGGKAAFEVPVFMLDFIHSTPTVPAVLSPPS